MEITKIVITGGPCAGKSTGMETIKEFFSNKGYTVIYINEVATDFISGGVAPWTCGTNLDYQIAQFKMQISKERIIEEAVRTMREDKFIILCDRGLLDNKAYMSEEEYQKVLDTVQLENDDIYNNYDAIFHLVSTAIGAESYYTNENNAARYETLDEAISLDTRIKNSWQGHPYLRVIDNSTDFKGKMKRLISEIELFLNKG